MGKDKNKNTPAGGLEPPTTRLKAVRSTNWAKQVFLTQGNEHQAFQCR